VSKTIARAQEKVEKQNFETRKGLLEYDDVLNQHRTVIYKLRREVLDSQENIDSRIQDMITACIQNVIAQECPKRELSSEAEKNIIATLSKLTHLSPEQFNAAGLRTENVETFTHDLINFILKQYDLSRRQLQPEAVNEAEKWIILEVLDKAWKQHMLNLDQIKEGIGLRGYGQKNPLIEYKREAFMMFQDMMNNITWEIVHHIFHMNLEHFNKQELEEQREKELAQMNVGGPTEESESSAELNRAQRRAQKKRR
ncbi:MAG TPA: hypothetical protein QGF02_01955, partial [Candidatus Babeliales bacterium]|nr:hypothetical protein [Candidatus Babeliales bacterium]